MELLFSKDHEWLKIEGTTGTMGISVYAVKQLGDITFVELPKTGAVKKQGDVLCSIESVKAASDIYMPISGKITGVNTALEDTPEIINESPEEKGWIAKFEITAMDEKSNLMSKEQYDAYIKGL
jgi:glycine cleavage system H protein